ncbi:hypothetical protein [Vibrio rarus]|uniref:hypothetical protein n=1 Tax=Vibrio rarus TaxID=413403 RepID=UPI0021C28F54|nr:hypothetical protein [Vibrio rarus]
MAALNPYWYLAFISSQHPFWTEQDFRSSGQWFDCAEDKTPRFCTDRVTLHHTSVFAEVSFASPSSPILEVNSEFSLTHFNGLQLGLRQDGFQLIKIDIAGVLLDIEQQRQQHSFAEVDRQVLSLIHRHKATTSRTLYWRSDDTQRTVLWKSDQNGIHLIYAHNELMTSLGVTNSE